MPRHIHINDLIQIKQEHKFHWKWVGNELPPKKIVGKNSRAYFQLICGKCNKTHWVEWGALKRGHTKQCRKCADESSLPALEEMEAVAKKYNMLWKPTTITKTDKKTKRRLFWMKCTGCNHNHWIRWNQFQQGLHKSCRSCARRSFLGTLQDPYPSKHPIKARWRQMVFEKNFMNIELQWETFFDFLRWTLDQQKYVENYSKFKKKIKSGPNNSENCYWTTRETGSPNFVNIRGYL